MAGGLGFEPRLTESESAVLPLDDPPNVRTHTNYKAALLGGLFANASYKLPSAEKGLNYQRLEYCGRFLVLCRPYFLRSTALASLVT